MRAALGSEDSASRLTFGREDSRTLATIPFMDSLASTNGPPIAAKQSRTWVWYFAILAGLSIAATTTMIVYNLKQQLTPEQLQAAVARWNERGPANYDMEYTKQTAAAESLETYAVEVRGGKVVKVVVAPGLRGKDTQWQPVEGFIPITPSRRSSAS